MKRSTRTQIDERRSSLKHLFGDPRFLREVTRCVGQRCTLIGLEPPDPPPPDKAKQPSLEERNQKAFANYLQMRIYYGNPPYDRVMGLTAEQTAAIMAANMGNEPPLPPVDACTGTPTHVAATS
jgi:hypothetical protein